MEHRIRASERTHRDEQRRRAEALKAKPIEIIEHKSTDFRKVNFKIKVFISVLVM